VIVLGLLDSDDQSTAGAAVVPFNLLQALVYWGCYLYRGLFWRCGDRDRGVDEGEWTSFPGDETGADEK
jgi:hypothetical protein